MADYYSLLERKIKETLDDPAKARQVVYEAARLALKRQVLVQQPPIAVRETWRLMNDLEDAIARCEADWAETDRRKSTNLQARQTRETESRPKRGYASGDGEADEAVATTHRAARQDRTAGRTHASRANGRYADSEEDEAPARPTYDRRMRSDPRSGLRATDRDDRRPMDLDEGDEAGARANRATRERQTATDARANGRYASESEEDQAWTTHPPTHSRRVRSDPRSGFRSTDRDDHGEVDLDKSDDAFASTSRAAWEERRASVAHAPRANGRSPFAQSEEDQAHARPRYDRQMRGDPGSGLRADPNDRTTNPDEDSRSAPLEPEVEEPPNRPRNRFREPSRELVLVPSRSTYMVRPDDFPPSTDIIYEAPPDPVKVFGPMLWSGARVVLQVAVTVLAAAAVAFYVTAWQRNIGPPAQIAPATVAQDQGPPGHANSPAAAAGSSGAGETAAPATAGAVLTMPPPAPVAAALPYPTSYGIYAISDNQLIELEQIPTAPVDPRTRTTLQIVRPGRTTIADAHLTFIAYRRDFLSSAPEKVPVRIAARIAHSMIFDSSGKPVVTTPENATWLIRDKGYDLRVSPVRDSAEMVTLRPENPDLVFPAGRYELLLGGQYYDFIVAGNVTDPAQCVEGFATVRGPAFYECKTQ